MRRCSRNLGDRGLTRDEPLLLVPNLDEEPPPPLKKTTYLIPLTRTLWGNLLLWHCMVTAPGSLAKHSAHSCDSATHQLQLSIGWLSVSNRWFPKRPIQQRSAWKKDYWMARTMTVLYCSVPEKLVSQDSKIVYGQLTNFVNNALLSMQRKKKKKDTLTFWWRYVPKGK